MLNNDIQERVKDKKRWLFRYRKNVACVDRLQSKLDNLNDRIQAIRTPNLSGMPRGGTPVTIADLISDKTDLEDRIARLKNKGADIKREILAEIDSLDDYRQCEILEDYFIDMMSIDDIAYAECYTSRYVYKLYEEAIVTLATTSVIVQ